MSINQHKITLLSKNTIHKYTAVELIICLKITDFLIICSNIVSYKMVFHNTYSVLLSEWKDKLRLIFTPRCHIRTFTRHKRFNHILGFR